MNSFTVTLYMCIICLLIVVPTSIYYGAGMIYVGMDAINTRSLECQNVVVENTSSFNDGYGITFFVNERVILDTSNGSIIKKWGKLEPRDVVYMKYGKQTAVFC